MKKILTIAAVLVIFGLLCGMSFAATEAKKPEEAKKATEVKKPVVDKNTKVFRCCEKVFTVKLKDGELTAAAAHQKDKATTIDVGVSKFWVVPTGVGPMVAYHQGDLLYLSLLNHDANMVYRKQFAKAPYKAVHMNSETFGAYIHIERLNNDVLVVKADGKDYKYVKLIKFQPVKKEK
jgi:hypothetical protein